jgi:hypothetical protein
MEKEKIEAAVKLLQETLAEEVPVGMIRSEQEIRYALRIDNSLNLDKRTLEWVLYEDKI